MILEKADLAAIRLCERRAMFPSDADLAGAGLGREEFKTRLQRLSSQGLVRSFNAVLVVPPLLGGDWVWGGVLANAGRPLGLANALARRLPFVTETVLNLGLPERLGPNFGLLFYSREFETEAQFIRSAPGTEYNEVFRVAEYSFPMAQPLSGEERALLRFLVKCPAADVPELAAGLGQTQTWVQAKLDRLLWTEANRAGMVRIQPELDWSRAENFGHFHFLLETGLSSEQLGRLLAGHGFELVLGGKAYRDRYVQMEADVWGSADLMQRVSLLDQVAGVRVAGVVWNQRIIVNTSWVAGLLD